MTLHRMNQQVNNINMYGISMNKVSYEDNIQFLFCENASLYIQLQHHEFQSSLNQVGNFFVCLLKSY